MKEDVFDLLRQAAKELRFTEADYDRISGFFFAACRVSGVLPEDGNAYELTAPMLYAIEFGQHADLESWQKVWGNRIPEKIADSTVAYARQVWDERRKMDAEHVAKLEQLGLNW